MSIDPSIFKSYDIRGIYPIQINEENTVQIVKAIYKFLIIHWKEFFVFDYYATRLKVSQRSIVDLVGVDQDYFYLIELKFRPIRRKDGFQLKRYAKDFLHHKLVKQILIGYNHKTQRLEVKI